MDLNTSVQEYIQIKDEHGRVKGGHGRVRGWTWPSG